MQDASTEMPCSLSKSDLLRRAHLKVKGSDTWNIFPL